MMSAAIDNVPIVSKILIAGVFNTQIPSITHSLSFYIRRITDTCTGFRCTLNLNGQASSVHIFYRILIHPFSGNPGGEKAAAWVEA